MTLEKRACRDARESNIELPECIRDSCVHKVSYGDGKYCGKELTEFQNHCGVNNHGR